MATPTNGGTAVLPYYVAPHGANGTQYKFRVEDVSALTPEEKIRVAQAHSGARTSSAPVLNTFPENLEEVLNGYEQNGQLVTSKQKDKQRPNENSAFEQEQLTWIKTHGSDHIKRAIDRGYHVTGLYARERAALEFPGFIVDTQNAVSLKERISPTAEALELEEETETKLSALSNSNGEDVRIMWAGSIQSGSQDTDLSAIKREVIVVSNYLGRYALIKPVARPLTQDTMLSTNPVSVHVTNVQNHAKAAHAKATNKVKRSAPPFLLQIKTQFIPGRPLVISFASPKGGVGKSTTATNVAAYIAKAAEISGRQDLRVLLVDGDIVNGTLALRVTGKLEPNLLDLLNHMDEVQSRGGELSKYEQDIGRFMLAHPKLANLDILGAPDNPDVITQIEQADLDYLMKTFARFYDVIIFDTGTQITDHTNCAWLNYSQQVYFMAEPEITCLQATAEYAKRARRLQLLTPDVCRLIMTRCDLDADPKKFDPGKAASEVFSFIPPDRAFFMPDFHQEALAAANAGEFLVLTSAAYATSVGEIAKHALERYEHNANQEVSTRSESVQLNEDQAATTGALISSGAEGRYSEASKNAVDSINSYYTKAHCTDLYLSHPERISAKIQGEEVRIPVGFASLKEYTQVIDDLLSEENDVVVEEIRRRGQGVLRRKNGDRMAVLLPPLTDMPQVVISKKRAASFSLESFLENEDPTLHQFFREAIQCRKNIMVVGGMGSGKSSLLRVLAENIDPHERIAVVEEIAELGLEGNGVSNFYIGKGRGSNIESVLTTIKHMAFDHLLLEGLVGAAVQPALDIMATDSGVITTVHSGSIAMMFEQLRNALISANATLDEREAVCLLRSRIDIVVRLDQIDGTQRITHILRRIPTPENIIVGPDHNYHETPVVGYQTLWKFEPAKGCLVARKDPLKENKAPSTSLLDTTISAETIQLLPAYIARTCRAVPFQLEPLKKGSQLCRVHIALTEFENIDIKETVKAYLQAQDQTLQVEFVQEEPQVIDKLIQAHYGT